MTNEGIDQVNESQRNIRNKKDDDQCGYLQTEKRSSSDPHGICFPTGSRPLVLTLSKGAYHHNRRDREPTDHSRISVLAASSFASSTSSCNGTSLADGIFVYFFHSNGPSRKTNYHEDLTGRVALVEFWATWCPPCRGTLGWLGELKRRYGERLVVLAVAIESEEANVREVANKLNPLSAGQWDHPNSPESSTMSALGQSFLFDKKGNTAEIYYRAPPDLHQRAEQDIESLLK